MLVVVVEFLRGEEGTVGRGVAREPTTCFSFFFSFFSFFFSFFSFFSALAGTASTSPDVDLLLPFDRRRVLSSPEDVNLSPIFSVLPPFRSSCLGCQQSFRFRSFAAAGVLSLPCWHVQLMLRFNNTLA
jgi:hypothetical protein